MRALILVVASCLAVACAEAPPAEENMEASPKSCEESQPGIVNPDC
jgi:hypothetical protein